MNLDEHGSNSNVAEIVARFRATVEVRRDFSCIALLIPPYPFLVTFLPSFRLLLPYLTMAIAYPLSGKAEAPLLHSLLYTSLTAANAPSEKYSRKAENTEYTPQVERHCRER